MNDHTNRAATGHNSLFKGLDPRDRVTPEKKWKKIKQHCRDISGPGVARDVPLHNMNICGQVVCVTRFDQSECVIFGVIMAVGKTCFEQYMW